MSSRTCPYCHHHYSASEYMHHAMFHSQSATVACVKCGRLMGFGLWRRLTIEFIALLLFLSIPILYLLGSGQKPGITAILSLFALYLVTRFGLVHAFAVFRKVEKRP